VAEAVAADDRTKGGMMSTGKHAKVGTIRYEKSKKQYRIKIECHPLSRRRYEWISLPRYIWQRDVGDIPPGYAIYVKNGDQTDVRLENLECISRREVMDRHRIQSLYPSAMIAVLRAHKKLKRAIDEKQN
jgi:hypothetical protein